MGMYLRLAWRNLWRNPRRSLISISAVVFAVVIAVAMRSMQLGFYARSIDNVVSFYTGYLQVHAPGYQAKPSLDLSFDRPDSIRAVVDATPGVTFSAPRLEGFALVSAGTISDGVQVTGIDPTQEDRLTGLSRKVSAGRYLTRDDQGILLGSGLADHLHVTVGDTIVALGAGYHGVTAAGKFPVVGIVTFPTPQLNAMMTYLTLPRAQDFFGATGRVTSVAVMLRGPRALHDAAQAVARELGAAYEVITWREMLPEMVQYITLDNASGEVMLLLVYTVVGFGVLGTVLMMTVERRREFGVLIAVGMSKSSLRLVVLIESVLLSLAGAVLGLAISVPIVFYLKEHPLHMTGRGAEALLRYGFEPVFPFSLAPSIFVWQTVTVLVIALVAAVYPLMRITTLDAVEAMR